MDCRWSGGSVAQPLGLYPELDLGWAGVQGFSCLGEDGSHLRGQQSREVGEQGGEESFVVVLYAGQYPPTTLPLTLTPPPHPKGDPRLPSSPRDPKL